MVDGRTSISNEATSVSARTYREIRNRYTNDGSPNRQSREKSQRDCGSFVELRPAPLADGGGTIGPMSPSGASSRSTMTGA